MHTTVVRSSNGQLLLSFTLDSQAEKPLRWISKTFLKSISFLLVIHHLSKQENFYILYLKCQVMTVWFLVQQSISIFISYNSQEHCTNRVTGFPIRKFIVVPLITFFGNFATFFGNNFLLLQRFLIRKLAWKDHFAFPLATK